MRCYGFGEGLIARATQPRQPSKDDQIAALRAENERLRAALFRLLEHAEERNDDYDATSAARAALGKGAA